MVNFGLDALPDFRFGTLGKIAPGYGEFRTRRPAGLQIRDTRKGTGPFETAEQPGQGRGLARTGRVWADLCSRTSWPVLSNVMAGAGPASTTFLCPSEGYPRSCS